MYDGYMGMYVDICWVYGGVCGCKMGIWVYMWMKDRYLGMCVFALCGCTMGIWGYMSMYDWYMGTYVDE